MAANEVVSLIFANKDELTVNGKYLYGLSGLAFLLRLKQRIWLMKKDRITIS
jgi:hypothetical protein